MSATLYLGHHTWSNLCNPSRSGANRLKKPANGLRDYILRVIDVPYTLLLDLRRILGGLCEHHIWLWVELPIPLTRCRKQARETLELQSRRKLLVVPQSGKAENILYSPCIP